METRPRDYDARPVSNFERHRTNEREYDRPNRDFSENVEQPRRTDTYPPDNARSFDRPRRYEEEYGRPPMQDGPQSSRMCSSQL